MNIRTLRVSISEEKNTLSEITCSYSPPLNLIWPKLLYYVLPPD